VEAAGNVGIVSTGDNAINQQHVTVLPPGALAPPAEVAPRPGLVNLPQEPGVFVGRAAELDQLTTLAGTDGPGPVVVAAVHGLGGVGKSTLAARYAAAHRDEFTLIRWITAATPAGIADGLARLATALQPALGGAVPAEVLAEWAVQWLASHDRWLLILDNVTDPTHVRELLARAPGGQVVITSRRATGWQGIATPVRLDVLTPAEGRQLLTDLITGAGQPPGPKRLAGAGELCAELGFLPLAVEQAGAYLAETALTPHAYRQLLAQYPASMYTQTAEGGDAQRTIARIWRLTLDQLAATPLAGDLLRILAFYAPDAIPRALLDRLGASPPDLATALGRLAAYNMITLEQDTVAVHRLVQAVTRTPDPADRHRTPAAIDTAREQATTLLAQALPGNIGDPVNWPTWRALAPHAEAIAACTAAPADSADTANLLNQTARFLHEQGALGRAISLFERSMADRRRMLGEDHPDTLSSRNNLAGAYESVGDLGRAIPLYEATLADRRRVLGENHPSTLNSRSNLAYAYRVAGDLGRAIPLYEATLADRRRILGENHPDTLISRGNLAYAYQVAGDLGRAIPLCEATLADRRRILGDDHPDTLASRNSLAAAYQAAGDLDRAIPLYEATLADRRRVLGEDHPDTLSSRGSLADAYRVAGDVGRAIPLLEAALADRTRVLGEDHPDTLTSRGNLAGAYEAAGDLGRAISLLEATLADCRRVLGEDHPLARAVRGNLEALTR
jgi:tetratricopeptide (TPR) repeat protein